jgi:hypothetical protein
VVDHEDIDWAFAGFQSEPELFLKSRREGWTLCAVRGQTRRSPFEDELKPSRPVASTTRLSSSPIPDNIRASCGIEVPRVSSRPVLPVVNCLIPVGAPSGILRNFEPFLAIISRKIDICLVSGCTCNGTAQPGASSSVTGTADRWPVIPNELRCRTSPNRANSGVPEAGIPSHRRVPE